MCKMNAANRRTCDQRAMALHRRRQTVHSGSEADLGLLTIAAAREMPEPSDERCRTAPCERFACGRVTGSKGHKPRFRSANYGARRNTRGRDQMTA